LGKLFSDKERSGVACKLDIHVSWCFSTHLYQYVELRVDAVNNVGIKALHFRRGV